MDLQRKKNELIRKSEVMRAYAEGEDLEWKLKKEFKWVDISVPSFNWSVYDYRVKPKIKLGSYKSRGNLIIEYEGIEVATFWASYCDLNPSDQAKVDEYIKQLMNCHIT